MAISKMQQKDYISQQLQIRQCFFSPYHDMKLAKNSILLQWMPQKNKTTYQT